MVFQAEVLPTIASTSPGSRSRLPFRADIDTVHNNENQCLPYLVRPRVRANGRYHTKQAKILDTLETLSLSQGSTGCYNVNAIHDMKQIAASTEAFQVLNKWLHLPDEDAKFWWLSTGSPLAVLIHQASHSANSQYACLLFLYHCIVPFLGPRPMPSGRPANWKSFMTDDFSPIEYSWSWDTPKGPPKIRFSIEAIGRDAGTKLDPFNQKMTDELIHRVNSTVPNVDWQWFDHFRNMFYEPNSAHSNLADTIDPELSHTSSLFMAFELQNAEVAVKAYFIPVRAEQIGRSRLSVLSESIQSLQKPHLRFPSYDHLSAFLSSRSASSRLDIIGVAVDCVLPIYSRLKVYIRSYETSFDSVCDFLSMGGKLDTFSENTLQDFRSLWYSVLGLDDDLSTSEDLRPAKHYTAGVLYNFDIRAGSAMPEPKVYIPVKHYAPNDLVVAQGLTSYLKGKGKDRFTDNYMRALKGMCTHRSLADGCGLQTYISCAVQNTQFVLTSYMSPEIYHSAKWVV